MEHVKFSERPINPKENAGCLSSLFFWWTYGVIKEGRKKPYDVDDLPSPLSGDHASKLGNVLEKFSSGVVVCIFLLDQMINKIFWRPNRDLFAILEKFYPIMNGKNWFRELENSKRRNRKASLLRALFNTFWKELLYLTIIHWINELVISLSRQMLLGYFLVYLKETKTDSSVWNEVKIFGILLSLSYGLNNLISNHVLAGSYHLGCRIKIALSSLLYRKCLKLRSITSEGSSTGLIVNLMANDLAKFDESIVYFSFLHSGFMSTIIILTVITKKTNILSTILCFGSLLLATPILTHLSKLLGKYRGQTATATDKRIRMMNEIICGIQIIKMYAWEKPYEKLIVKLRSSEMKIIRIMLFLKGLRNVVSAFLSKFSMYVIIVVYSFNGGLMEPEMVFVVLGFCSIMAKVMCGLFFRSLGETTETLVSVKRVQRFLQLKEFQQLNIKETGNEKCAVEFQNVRASWSLDSNHDTLKDIKLTLYTEKLTTIIGEIGSGKSSLLSAILGELPVSEGKLNIYGSISYYSQVPWIFAATIKQNILFSEEFNAEKYKKVIQVCALDYDLRVFPDGDLTLIGDRGITLSGGQKARIALARAVYKDADIYLLDDPLSAVDAKVSKHIFEECILGYLKNKTRILVTHQVQFLREADDILLLHEGSIKIKGSLKDIINSDLGSLNILKKSSFSDESSSNSESNETCEIQNEDINVQPTNQSSTRRELEKEDNEKAYRHPLLRYFIRGGGIFRLMLMIFMFILTQMFFSSCDVWLSIWTSEEAKRQSNMTMRYEKWDIFSWQLSMTKFFVLVYTFIIMGLIICVCLRNALFAHLGYMCSKHIHKEAFYSVLRTYSSFFHSNPSGRILNRFSKDMGTVDGNLLTCLFDAASAFSNVAAAFIISASVNVMYIIPATVVFILLLMARRFYLKASVNMKRLESITKSPVFVHLHTTLQGLPVIRASCASGKLTEEFDSIQDSYTCAWYLYNMTGFGYAYCLELLCFLYLVCIVSGSFLLDLSGSQIGLALSQITVLLNFVQWSMKQSAEVSNQVSSIDRLLRYAKLEPEAQFKNKVLTDKWPTRGKIVFEDVLLRYTITAEPAIENVTFAIEPEQKVGIVGRTGAGKTSLLAALFRLGYVEGSITIDNVDTSRLRLDMLRSHISVIPQDPILFTGTIRKNLDPFGEYDDSVLWNALAEAQLKKVISEDGSAGLDAMVLEGGKNFSVGQRQLICLARALIRNNRILILDEATANVDQQTDNIIQKTIKEKFAFCTVLTIAHRLNTVIDSDKILVMDRGTVVEFGHPFELLSNEHGYFYKLVSETGDAVAGALMMIAKENYENQGIKIKKEL